MGASGNPNITRISALNDRKKALEDKLQKYNLDLRQLCIKEAELTGVIPIEYPLEPGEKPPVFQKTGFQISPNLLNNLNNGEETVCEMELELQVLAQMADAAQGLANDPNMGKTVRRHHRSEYEAIKKRYEALLERIQFSEESYHVASRYSSTIKNNSQPKQKKKPRPSENNSYSTVSGATSVKSVASSFCKESPLRRSSRSLVSVQNLVSTPLQRAESSGANVGRIATGNSDEKFSSTSGRENGHVVVSRSQTVADVGNTSPAVDDMNNHFYHMSTNIGRRGPTRFTPQRFVHEENQMHIDGLLYRQQVLQHHHEYPSQKSEHQSMYNINKASNHVWNTIVLSSSSAGDVTYTQNSIDESLSSERAHSVIYRHSPTTLIPLHQLQPHQLYSDVVQLQQHQQQQLQQSELPQVHNRYYNIAVGSPMVKCFKTDVTAVVGASVVDPKNVPLPMPLNASVITPIRYGSLDRRRDRPQRTLTNTQSSHEAQRPKNITKGKVRWGSSRNAHGQGVAVRCGVHQQLQRTQSLGNVQAIALDAINLAADASSADMFSDDTSVTTGPKYSDVINANLNADVDNHSSCGSNAYSDMNASIRRTKERNWYESSVDDRSTASIEGDSGDVCRYRPSDGSALAAIAPEDKYRDVHFRQRATTVSAPLTSGCSVSVRPVSTQHSPQSHSTHTQQLHYDLQHQPYQYLMHKYDRWSMLRSLEDNRAPTPPVSPRPSVAVINTRSAPILSPMHAFEIPAESKPNANSGGIDQPVQIFTSPIPKNGTLVQIGHCKPYQEETKPFEMSDYYKYSTKHNKASLTKLQSPSTSISMVTASPQSDYQHSAPNSANCINLTFHRTMDFTSSSGSNNQSPCVYGTGSRRKSINNSFDISPAQNVTENYAIEMNQWLNKNTIPVQTINVNNNSNNTVHNKEISFVPPNTGVSTSPRKPNPTTTATLV